MRISAILTLGSRGMERRWVRRQRSYFHEDTTARRREITKIASELAEQIRERSSGRVSRPRRARICWRDVWLTYIRDRWPDIPDRVITVGGPGVRELLDLPPAVRVDVPSPRTLLGVIQLMNRVTKWEAYSPDACVDDAQPVDWENFTRWRMMQKIGKRGRYFEPGTVATDHRKFRAAINHCMRKWRQWWSGRPDPLAGAKVVTTEVRTTEKIYKRVRPEKQAATADVLDRVRGRSPRPPREK